MRTFTVWSSTLAALIVAGSTPLGAQSTSPRVVGDLCTGGSGEGTGLRGAYYSANPDHSSPVLVRIDARINSDTVRNLPSHLAATQERQVRWCGWIRPIASGPHQFHSGTASVRIHVASRPVAGPRAGEDATVELQAGKTYPILIEVPRPDEATHFSLKWTPPFGATYEIPQTLLYPPVETVSPGC